MTKSQKCIIFAVLTQVFSVRHGVPVDEVTTQEYALQCFTFPQAEFVVEEEPQALEVSISYPESHMEGDLLVADLSANGSFSNLITQTSANANTIVQAPLMFVRGSNVAQAAARTTQATTAATGPLSVVIAPAPTTCTSIQAPSTPRTSATGTAVSLSAVSPSAARRKLAQESQKQLQKWIILLQKHKNRLKNANFCHF